MNDILKGYEESKEIVREDRRSEGVVMDKLKQYIENSSYCVEEIAEQLIELSNLEPSKELRQELGDGLHYLKACAENKYDQDYFRILYNVLLVITGNEQF